MNNKTENYIILKPIAERFNRISSEITDEEIKQLIKSSLKEQLETVNFASVLSDMVENYFEDENNVDKTRKLLEEGIKNRLK